MKWTFTRTLKAIWPPLPVWQRLDAAVFAVAGYTLCVVAVIDTARITIPSWSGASAVLNALILGVLLGFRNRESYDRWWEGRRLWGQLVNDSRDLCLKLSSLKGIPDETRHRIGVLVVGFAIALKRSLRGEGTLQQIPGFEKETATPAHVPLHLAGTIFDLVQAERSAGRLTEIEMLTLDPHLRSFMDVCGACERIRSTPIPLSYRSLLRHGLVLYLLSTPWLVSDQLGWWSIPAMALLAYFLLGIELTAEDVEEPFGSDGDDLALTAYCETIRNSVSEVLS